MRRGQAVAPRSRRTPPNGSRRCGRGQHGEDRLGDHRHIDQDAVARAHPQPLQHRGDALHLGVQLAEGVDLSVPVSVEIVDQRRLARRCVGSQRSTALWQRLVPAADEPFGERRPGIIEHLRKRLLPVDALPHRPRTVCGSSIDCLVELCEIHSVLRICFFSSGRYASSHSLARYPATQACGSVRPASFFGPFSSPVLESTYRSTYSCTGIASSSCWSSDTSQDRLLLLGREPAREVGPELLYQQRNAFVAAARVADRIFDHDFVELLAVVEFDRQRVGDRALLRIVIIPR